MRPKRFARAAGPAFVPLAALAGLLLLGASPAQAGDEFERGFKDELGRIAAHEAVHVGRHVLREVVGEVAVYDRHGPRHDEPPHWHQPRYVPPKHHGKHAWKHHRKHHHKHGWHPGHCRHHDGHCCGERVARHEHDYPRHPAGRRHAAYGRW